MFVEAAPPTNPVPLLPFCALLTSLTFSSHSAHVLRTTFIPSSAESAEDKAIDLTNSPVAGTFVVLKDFSFMN